jgi:hypothetical protein
MSAIFIIIPIIFITAIIIPIIFTTAIIIVIDAIIGIITAIESFIIGSIVAVIASTIIIIVQTMTLVGTMMDGQIIYFKRLLGKKIIMVRQKCLDFFIFLQTYLIRGWH